MTVYQTKRKRCQDRKRPLHDLSHIFRSKVLHNYPDAAYTIGMFELSQGMVPSFVWNVRGRGAFAIIRDQEINGDWQGWP